VRVELANLGRWGSSRLLAEYDPEGETIRVSAEAHHLVRERLGEVAARNFLAYAIAHERFHRLHPAAGEVEAHAFARAQTGLERTVFENVLRG
jgi:hypothetical protein